MKQMNLKAKAVELYDHWKNKNPAIQFLELPGINHYSILELCWIKHLHYILP